MSFTLRREDVLDLVGLGFGPANIAIAGALTEQWADEKNAAPYPVKKVLFIEKHTHFRWHPGMLLPDAKMQISFMKDLATLRNPKSPYTFLSYLHSQDRLISFINRGSTIPTRKEYADYLSWAASEVQANGINVLYGHEIVGINEAPEKTIAIRYRDLSTGEETVIRSKNIIISPGGTPRVPAFVKCVVKHPHVVHSSAYATSISKTFDTLSGVTRPLRVAVIGSGQSAAEVTIDLRARLSNIPTTGRHQIDMLIRKGALKPSDDSPFANEIFDPASTDTHFSTSSRQLREMKLAEYKLTNYGVVNPRTLEALYEIIYGQRLDAGIAHRLGDRTPIAEAFIDIKPYRFVAGVNIDNASSNKAQPELLLSPESTPSSNGGPPTFMIKTQNMINLAVEEETYDAIVYATGYERSTWVNTIKDSDIASHFGLDSLTSEVRLVPDTEVNETQPKLFTASASDSGSSTSTTSSSANSANSSPPTSPEIGTFSSAETKHSQSKEVFITRNYRLLPSGYVDSPNHQEKKCFSPRIYLQGCEESTHGLSDTLLSVLGVRAGEVVRDLTYTL